MHTHIKRISTGAAFTALALILSYVESLVPAFFALPGMKIGLTNIMVVFALYGWGEGQALSINIMRIILAGFMFGNMYSILYSLAGGLLSFAVMYIMKKSRRFSVVGVSMAGGVFHNVGQLIVAFIVVQNKGVFYYLPPLLIAGCVTGFLIGLLADRLLSRLRGFII